LSFEEDGCFTCAPQGECYFDGYKVYIPDSSPEIITIEAYIHLQSGRLYRLSYFLKNGDDRKDNFWTTTVTMTDPPFSRTFDTLLNNDPFETTFREFSFSVPQPDATVKLAFFGRQVCTPFHLSHNQPVFKCGETTSYIWDNAMGERVGQVTRAVKKRGTNGCMQSGDMLQNLDFDGKVA
jgi:hypothetical protein